MAMKSPETGRKTILIVDDDELNRKLFGLMLSARGYRILHAGDGYQGLDLVREEHPDLVIMDLGLPDMSGLEATHRLKTDKDTGGIPVIIATAYMFSDDQLWASGCDAFIMKPFTAPELIKMVETVLTRTAARM
jgi:two-component system cell cycle response regulator DivK